jgi:hypothetical protein
MSLPKLQTERAILIPANGIEIPYPANILASGSSTGVALNKLVATGANFITKGVRAGDIVYNIQSPAFPISATVTAVDSENQLSISANNFTASPNAYVVYQSGGNNGVYNYPILYIGTSGNLAVETEGGEIIAFSNVQVGFFPFKIRRVLTTAQGVATTASGLIALF